MENIYQVDVQLTEEDKNVIKKHVESVDAPNCYLEIGVHQGGSAIQVLEAAKPDVELYGVDILNNFRLKDTRFNFIHSPSVEAAKTWNKPIGALFIDGDHDNALADFNAWKEFVIADGTIFFHDYAMHSPQVIKDCEEVIKDTNYKLIFRPKLGHGATSIFQIKKIK